LRSITIFYIYLPKKYQKMIEKDSLMSIHIPFTILLPSFKLPLGNYAEKSIKNHLTIAIIFAIIT